MNVAFYERSSGREICKTAGLRGRRERHRQLAGLRRRRRDRGEQPRLRQPALHPARSRVPVRGSPASTSPDGACEVAWTSDEIAPSSVAKVSLANGLAYAYTKKPNWWGVSAWYLTALDVTHRPHRIQRPHRDGRADEQPPRRPDHRARRRGLDRHARRDGAGARPRARLGLRRTTQELSPGAQGRPSTGVSATFSAGEMWSCHRSTARRPEPAETAVPQPHFTTGNCGSRTARRHGLAG